VDDIFEAIMPLNASSDLELGLQNVTCKSQNPVPAYSQETVVTNLEIGTIKTFEGVSVRRDLSTFLCYK
jgi:hypothetical protein